MGLKISSARVGSTIRLNCWAGAFFLVIPEFILRAGHKDFLMDGEQNLSKNSTKPNKSHAPVKVFCQYHE
jgi:urease alpha subunit